VGCHANIFEPYRRSIRAGGTTSASGIILSTGARSRSPATLQAPIL
jgi:hypothetical protein